MPRRGVQKQRVGWIRFDPPVSGRENLLSIWAESRQYLWAKSVFKDDAN